MATKRLYAGKDFDTLVQQVKSKLRAVYEPKGVTFDFTNDLTSLLLDQASYVAELVNFFQDLQANDVYLPTIQSREALDRYAAARAYNPAGAVPSSGQLVVTPQAAPVSTAIMPNGFGFLGPQGLRYEAVQSYTFPLGSTASQVIDVSQRETRNLTFGSDGSPFQVFNLGSLAVGEFLAYRSLEVVIDGVTWTERDAFLDTDTTVYRVAYTPSTPYIEFGDGAVGLIPPDGASIAVKFAVTRAEQGIIPAGEITGAADDLLVLGTPLPLTVESSDMRGGKAPETAVITKARLPLAKHSDGAVVVKSDFDGLVGVYRDPVFGAVEAARAVLATSIDNDMVSLSIITQLRGLIVDALAEIALSDTAIAALATDIQARLTATGAALQSIADDLDAGSPLDVALTQIDSDVVDLRDASNGLSTEASFVQTSVSTADNSVSQIQSQLSSIRSAIVGVGSGGTIAPATYSSLIALLDQADSATEQVSKVTSPSGAVSNSLGSVIASTATIRSLVSSQETQIDAATQSRTTAQADLVDEIAALALVGPLVSGFNDEVDDLQQRLVNPYNGALDKLTELEQHLDGVFADVCGPNLITVPILTRDSDGYYAAAPNGLVKSLEAYLDARKEPSVVFRVLSGDGYFVAPTLTVVFQEIPGDKPLKIKSDIQSRIEALIKGKTFGSDLDLDELYKELESLELERVNITITGFTGAAFLKSFIDSEGNLSVDEREIVHRPTFNFFRRLPNGSREAI